MATYSNSGHGAGPAHTVARSSHGLPMARNMTNGGVAAMDVFDQELNFDDSLLDGVHGLAPLPFTPSYEFDGFSNTFEDPFSYSARPAYDVPADGEPFNQESPAQDELDNKLLGFSAPLLKAQVVDSAGNFADTEMTAELLGMFFVAEDVFGGENTGRPLELTCYRRNLWQCSGQITLPRHISHIIDGQGQQLPVFELAASISAMESIEGKHTEIISIPWKSSSGEESKSPSAPPNVPLDLSAGQELDHNRISLPVSWKRLQFKHATANNGRRKGLQQHYVVLINLLSKTKSGEFVKIGEVQSGPVIVRGRSPRNFDSRKDVPLTVDKKGERRSTVTSSEAATPVPKLEKGADLAQNMQKYHSLGNVQQSSDWTPSPGYGQQSSHSAKKMAVSPNPNRPPVPSWSSDTSTSKNNSAAATSATPTTPRNNSFQRSAPSTLPINLSLSEDERSPIRSSTDSISPHFPKNHMASQKPQHSTEDDEEEEDLYEYFPLSLDDWMPPVDAIYRPHVVHHTIVPPELKAQQVRSRTKRYFSSD